MFPPEDEPSWEPQGIFEGDEDLIHAQTLWATYHRYDSASDPRWVNQAQAYLQDPSWRWWGLRFLEGQDLPDFAEVPLTSNQGWTLPVVELEIAHQRDAGGTWLYVVQSEGELMQRGVHTLVEKFAEEGWVEMGTPMIVLDTPTRLVARHQDYTLTESIAMLFPFRVHPTEATP